MLLGIVLHAALSFAPIPWTVQDSQQSDFYYVLFACIHGFRMPLFFMLSGFFTAMLWRKRGLASLVKHRFKRIFLPLVLGCLTIVPAMWAVSYVVSRPSPGSPESSALFAAVVSGNTDLVRTELQNPENDVNMLDANSGSSPLCTAVFHWTHRNCKIAGRCPCRRESAESRFGNPVARRCLHGALEGGRFVT